jgi:FKBP-type peptidyl-prolyl cis-trans isomerase FkpA
MVRFQSSIRLYSVIFVLCAICFSCNEDGKETETSSGYRYIHHLKNNTATPNVGDYVFYEMEVKGDSGEVIQSLKDLPNMPSFQIMDPSLPNYRLNPINEMMSKMSVNDSATLYYPIDSLPSIPQQFKNNDFISYTVIVKDFKDYESYMAHMTAMNEKRKEEIAAIKAMEPEMLKKTVGYLNQYSSRQFDDKVVTTETGLKYIIHEEGKGLAPEIGSKISTNYFLVLMDGTPVDNSFKVGTPYLFDLGTSGFVAGWSEAFSIFNKGTKASVIIPYELGYGVAGKPGFVPEKADLFFYVEVENFYKY